ncbi:MAG: DegV family protein [Coriobacteriia bacterium]
MEPRFSLVVDSCCDLPSDTIHDLGVEVLHFPYTLKGEEHIDDFGGSLPHGEFYDAMRAGEQPTTAQIPMHAFVDVFERAAAEGRSLVYLGFSSQLSGTFDVAHLARADVLSRHPDADIRVIDTLAASAAEGVLVYEAARRWRDGATADELEAWIAEQRPRLHGYFIIDDLETLRRGGRLSGTAAAAGALLDVKPLLTITTDGRLELKRNFRGRVKATRALVDLFEQHRDGQGGTVAIAHGDCAEDAGRLAAMLAEKTGVSVDLTMDVGPVIGAHTGPGMLALVFWGEAH